MGWGLDKIKCILHSAWCLAKRRASINSRCSYYCMLRWQRFTGSKDWLPVEGMGVWGDPLREVTANLSPKGWVGVYQVDKEKGVGRVGLCCPFHHELYHLLLLTQTLPSILGGERSRLIQVPPPRFFGMQEMPHWDAYWNSRPPDSSCCNLTPSPVSGPVVGSHCAWACDEKCI